MTAQEETKPLVLGQEVMFTHVLRRRREYTDRGYYQNAWVREPAWNRTDQRAPVRGILVGMRTLSNGRASYDYDEGWAYEAETTQQAALVAYGLRRSPVYVDLDDLVPVEESP